MRQKEDEHCFVTIQVKNQKTVDDALKEFSQGETVPEFKCDEGCGKKAPLHRRQGIKKLPNVLFLHLQRIHFDVESYRMQKINQRIEFPSTLNMRKYTSDHVLAEINEEHKRSKQNKIVPKVDREQQEDAKEQEEGDIEMGKPDIEMQGNFEQEELINTAPAKKEELDDEEFEYKLVGVNVHMGTADAGHYLSLINTNRSGFTGAKPEANDDWCNTSSEKWLEFNDSNVKEYAFANLENDCFGGVQRDAY